jgi:16S rRNA (cytosine967-C5)-methyltransferase
VNAFESSGTIRKFAVDILVRVDIDKAYADILLDQVLQRGSASEKDRSLLTEIVYGTLRWRGRLDFYLKQLTRRPLEKTDPFIRNLLRITLYQIDFLDRIPEYAAVNEAVNLAKAHGGSRVSGFVNGVLRNFIRTKKTTVPPDPTTGGITALAGYWSHPEWLIRNWIDYLGSSDIVPLLAASNCQAPLVLRANNCRTVREALLTAFNAHGIEASPAIWSPKGIRIHSHMPVDQLPGHQEGLFQVQGESSQLVTYILDPHPGENILDACAAPGGKTTHVAEFIGDRGQVTAVDPSANGIVKINENTTRLGLKSIRTIRGDMTKPVVDGQRSTYDRILVDAPCSGLGTLRSHPEIKWNRDVSDLTRLHCLQGKILAQAADNLKSDGILVYSTCTLSAVENENVVEEFLQRHREFVLEDAANFLPDQAKQLVRGKYFMALPHRHDTDGFFAARLRRVI